MSIHLSYIAGMAAKPLASIQNEMRKASHTSIPDNIYQLSNRITGVVRELSVINGKEVNIHRIFVHTGDSGAYETVGWVLACDVKHCMICSTSFGYFTYQYYCIACGNIVCQKCSVNEALVFEIRHLGLKRVCDQCYWGQVRYYMLWSAISMSPLSFRRKWCMLCTAAAWPPSRRRQPLPPWKRPIACSLLQKENRPRVPNNLSTRRVLSRW